MTNAEETPTRAQTPEPAPKVRVQSPEPAPKAPSLKPVLIVAVLVLTSSVLGTVWIYQQATRAIRVEAKVRRVLPDGHPSPSGQPVDEPNSVAPASTNDLPRGEVVVS